MGPYFCMGLLFGNQKVPSSRQCDPSRMHVAMASIRSSLVAVHGEDQASVRPITDALNANGFNCDIDMASGAFLGVAEGDLAALRLNIRQKATVRAAQEAERQKHGGGYR